MHNQSEKIVNAWNTLTENGDKFSAAHLENSVSYAITQLAVNPVRPEWQRSVEHENHLFALRDILQFLGRIAREETKQ